MPEVDAPTAPTESADLRRAALGSGAFLMIGFAAQQAIRFLSNIILAALLYPAALGLMSLATTVLVGLHMFADLGIRTSVVQSRRGDDPRFLGTAWTLSVIRGFALFAFSCLLAYPAAYWRAKPEPLLLGMLPILGLTAVFEGFTSTALYTMNRRLAQGRVMLLEVGAVAIGTAVTLIWVWLEPSPWALAGGAVVGAAVRTLLSHLILPGGQRRFHWDRDAVREMSRIGRWIYIGTACTFLAGYVDKLVVGFWSIATLGVYHIATALVQIPVTLMMAIAGQLTFPLFSRLLQRGHSAVEVFGPVHLIGNLAGSLLVAGLVATGPTAVLCLYDPRYHDAAWMLVLLAVGAWLQILEANAGAILFAQGNAHVSAASNAAKAAALFVLVPAGFAWMGLIGLIIGFVAGDVIRYSVTAYAVRRRGLHVFHVDVPTTVFTFGLGFGAAWLVSVVFSGPGAVRTDPVGVWLIGSGALPGTEALGSNFWGGYQRDWGVLLPRLLTAAAIVVLVWGATVAFLRSRGVIRWRW